jgi:hypothetical protein
MWDRPTSSDEAAATISSIEAKPRKRPELEGVATMTRLHAILFVVAVSAFVLAFGQVGAAATSAAAPKTVTVAMHDPGCHWFSANGKFTKSMTVNGPVALANYDQAALKVAGHNKVWHDGVGKKLVLARGTYKITMVGQAPDDNTLVLVVR